MSARYSITLQDADTGLTEETPADKWGFQAVGTTGLFMYNPPNEQRMVVVPFDQISQLEIVDHEPPPEEESAPAPVLSGAGISPSLN